MKTIENPTEAPDAYASWLDLWLAIRKIAIPGCNTFVIHEPMSLTRTLINFDHAARMALEEIITKLPDSDDMEVIRTLKADALLHANWREYEVLFKVLIALPVRHDD